MQLKIKKDKSKIITKDNKNDERLLYELYVDKKKEVIKFKTNEIEKINYGSLKDIIGLIY